MIRTLLSMLEKRRYLTICIAILYYLLVVLPHEQVGLWISTLFSSVSRASYNAIILVCFLALSLFLLLDLVKQIQTIKQALYVLLQGIIIWACFYYLIIVNIESIHFVQYFVLTMLLFTITKDIPSTLILVLFGALIDEGYQYFYLSPERTNYFDFNDIILDLVGAGSATLSLGVYGNNSTALQSRKYAYMAIAATAGFFAILYILNVWQVYASENHNFWVLIRQPEEGFWSFLNFDVVYHVIRPLEALVILIILFLFYTSFEWKTKAT